MTGGGAGEHETPYVPINKKTVSNRHSDLSNPSEPHGRGREGWVIGAEGAAGWLAPGGVLVR